MAMAKTDGDAFRKMLCDVGGCIPYCGFAAVIIPLAIIAIISIPIAGTYWNTNCDNSSFIPLGGWLVGNAILTTGFLIVGFGICIYGCITKKVRTGYFLIGVFVLVIILKAIWNIIGTVALFGFSSECIHDATGMWTITCIILIVQWIVGFCSIIGICCCGLIIWKDI